MAKVIFNYADRIPFFKNKRAIKNFVEQIFENERKKIKKINYVFCSDLYLLEINKKFLRHNYYTDVITFDLSEEKKEIIGEIYISVDRVLDNATHFKCSFPYELNRVIFHGALHLCGYDDKTAKKLKIMRDREDYYLHLFHVKR